MADLRQHSIEVILKNQSPSGAYIACPTMADYAYCWFRDGAFIAYAMGLVGEHSSARRFYDWGAVVINARAEVVERALAKVARGEPLAAADYLHTRYTLDGQDGTDINWPNFQLDGLGTWLWGLLEHLGATEDTTLPDHWSQAAELVARYLTGLWPVPNYDCWEEFGDKVHPHTLACIYAGLRAYSYYVKQTGYAEVADEVRTFVLEHGVVDGHFVKYLGSDAVDASLIGMATPYALVTPDDVRMQATVAHVEAELHRTGGGVRRYAWDSYYGGGEWLLLAAWLGWYYNQAGQTARAQELLGWVERQADAEGNLPEQIAAHLIAPDHYAQWVARRGPIANPLLWSHAMYLILYEELIP
jgi:GH15 family glucan-1,4-alpha-glucosidase